MTNLLTESWLQVTTKLGKTHAVALHQITEVDGETIVDFHAPRADFKGAIYQLLLGLLQCRFAPEDRSNGNVIGLSLPVQKFCEKHFHQ